MSRDYKLAHITFVLNINYALNYNIKKTMPLAIDLDNEEQVRHVQELFQQSNNIPFDVASITPNFGQVLNTNLL